MSKTELSCQHGISRLVLQDQKFYPFIDQACSVKMAGYWPGSFLRVYGPRLRRLRLRVYDLTLGQ